MKFIFIRHGETSYNKLRMITGWRIDAPLNEAGFQQARELVCKLENNFDIIISSPQKRAKQTAEVIKDHFNKNLIFNDYLREKDFGSLSGKTWKEIEEGGLSDARTLDAKQQYDYSPYGGESAGEVKERVEKFLEETKNNYAGKTVLVVTHGGIIRLMHFLYTKEEISHITNASAHEFEL